MMVYTRRGMGVYSPVNPPAFADSTDVAAGVAAGGTLATNGIYRAIVVGVAVSVASHFIIRYVNAFLGERRG